MIPLRQRSWIMNHDEVLTVVRPPTVVGGGVDYEDGKPVEAPAEQFQLACNVQPLTGQQLLLVPEGDRYQEQYMVYAQVPLIGVWMSLQVNDRVARKNRWFIVHEAKDWGGHVEARMVRTDVGPDAMPFP